MKTKNDLQGEILRAVFDDRDRSIEGTIERGTKAGIALERERFRSIFALSAPAGLEKAIITMALCGCSADAVAGMIAIYSNVSDEDARARRRAFRLINTEEVKNAG